MRRTAFVTSVLAAGALLAGAAVPSSAQPPASAEQARQAMAASRLFRVADYVAPVFRTAPDDPREQVILRLDVDAGGKVVDVVAIKGPTDQAMAARDAVRQWSFTAPPEGATHVFVGFNPSAQQSKPGQSAKPTAQGSFTPPRKTRDVRPRYPADAQKDRVQGLVVLDAVVDPAGLVACVRVLRGDPRLAIASIEAALQWQFTPLGVPFSMTLTTNFTLQ